jgi:uncharacterized damage-inducible protein DinB
MLNRDALRELFDYTDYTWAVFGNSVRALPAEKFTEAAPGSGWPALRNALFHIAAAWDEFLVERFDARIETVEVDDLTWRELNERRGTFRALLRRLLDESSDEALNGEVVSEAGGVTMTAGELITHLLLHDLRHHGDINTLLSQLGAPVPMSDYAVYRWFKQREGQGGAGRG